MKRFFLATAALASLLLASSQAWSADKLLNASYDVGRASSPLAISALKALTAAAGPSG